MLHKHRPHIVHVGSEYMPELKWSYGYFLVLGVVATICVTLYARLRHYGWL